MGVTTDGADGVFMIDKLKKINHSISLIRNKPEISKRKPQQKTAAIENQLLYLVLRGGNIRRWGFDTKYEIIVPHLPEKPKIGIDESTMRRLFPHSYEYFLSFKDELIRRGFIKKIGKGRPFYSLWKIGPYTFAPVKVIWQRMANTLRAVVIDNIDGRLIIPTDTTTFIPLDNTQEGHYLCAILNSSPVRLKIGTSTGSGRGFGAPSMLKPLSIPKFKEIDENHNQLVKLSKQCHVAEVSADTDKLSKLEAEIDKVAAKLWDITDNELEAIQGALKEMEKPKTQMRQKLEENKKTTLNQS